MKPKLKELIDDEEELTKTGRHKIHQILNYIVGHFYNNCTTYKPKEDDNDYERKKEYWGDSGHA